MLDVKQILARQAKWQKARRLLPWAEKLRLAEAMRETLRCFEALRASQARNALEPKRLARMRNELSARR